MDQYLEFVSNNTILVVGLLASFFLLVFTEIRRKTSGLVNVEPGQAVKLINNDAQVLDIRNAAVDLDLLARIVEARLFDLGRELVHPNGILGAQAVSFGADFLFGER